MANDGGHPGHSTDFATRLAEAAAIAKARDLAKYAKSEREAEAAVQRAQQERAAKAEARRDEARKAETQRKASTGGGTSSSAQSKQETTLSGNIPFRESTPQPNSRGPSAGAKLLKDFGARKERKSSAPSSDASRPTSAAGLSAGVSSASTARKSSLQPVKQVQEKVAPSVTGTEGTRARKDSLPSIGKRPAASNPALASNKMDLSTLGTIPKKRAVATAQSPDEFSSGDRSPAGIAAGSEERPPRWYVNQKPSKRNPAEAEVSVLLERLTAAINKKYTATVRDVLHELPFQQVSRALLKNNNMLTDGRGLTQLFDEPWPYDVRADAQELYLKWYRKIFETDLLRGIQLKDKSKKNSGDSIVKGYAGKVDFHAFGSNGLSNGQWFPTQLTTVRDGAHGSAQAGIVGKTGEGAYSCIMAGNSDYLDEDHGHEVLYCGTDTSTGSPTDSTQLMLASITSGNPVRFIRKSAVKSQWAPEVGYRYDGLYDVTGFTILNVPGNSKAARHRFKLVRRAGQDPIRGGKGPEARPTEQEIRRFQDDKLYR